MKKLIPKSIACIFLLCLCFVLLQCNKQESKIEQFQRYVGKSFPGSVKKLEIGGVDSMGGVSKVLCFEIANSDLVNLLKENDYILSEGDILKQTHISFKKKDGTLEELNGLEWEKKAALKKGVVADEIYLKKGSTYSHFWVLIVDKDGVKIYFRYYRV